MENRNENLRRVLYGFLAIFVAVVIWYYVDETGNNGGPQTTEREITDIPILYVGEDTVLADRGLMLLEEGTDQTIDITVQGGRRKISWMDASDVSVIAYLSNVTNAGEQQISYVYNIDPHYGNDVIVTKKSIPMATVNISELYRKTVEVRCELMGNVAEGYNAGQLQLSHTSIDIWGQETAVSPVSYAKVTLDIGNAEASVSEALNVEFYDSANQPLDKANIRTTVQQVQATLPVFVTKELRLVVNFIDAPGARLQNTEHPLRPETITVSGPAEALRDRETIVVGDFELLSMVRDGVSRHTYSIMVPEGCTNLSGVTQTTLTISFLDMMETRVTTNNIRFENAPEGRDVDIITEEVTVSIFGTAENVSAVTGENIALVADLSGYSAALGTYTIPARVEISSGGDVGVQGSYQVQVTIRESPPPEEDSQSQEAGETA